MTQTLTLGVNKVWVVVVAGLLSLAVLLTTAAGSARAENFCEVKIPGHGECHGPWASAKVIYAVEETKGEALCATLQGWNGKYYNIYGWDCGIGSVLYEFPRANGFPTIGNPNSNYIRVGGMFF